MIPELVILIVIMTSVYSFCRQTKTHLRVGTRQAWARKALAPPLSPFPGNAKCVCAAVVLSEVSVDEVFMHYFEKITPTGALPLDPDGGLTSFRSPHCPFLEKILLAPMHLSTFNYCFFFCRKYNYYCMTVLSLC